jgi:hypothetical protein
LAILIVGYLTLIFWALRIFLSVEKDMLAKLSSWKLKEKNLRKADGKNSVTLEEAVHTL